MKIFSKRNIIIMAVVVLIVGYFIYLQTAPKPREITSVKTIRGSLVQSVEPSGSVKSKTAINLNFDTIGRIAAINVKVGDQVKNGQLLAKIDSRNLEAAVKQAQADLAKAQGSLDSYLAGSTIETIAQYEADVKKAEANLSKAKIDLENLRASLAQAYQNAYSNQITNLQGAITPMESALTDMDTVLGLLNSSANDYFDKAISYVDNQSFLFAYARVTFNEAITKVAEAKKSVNGLTVNSDVDSANLKIKSALEIVSKALNDTWEVLDEMDTSNPNNEITIESVVTKKNTLDTDRATITTKRTTIATGEQTIASAKLNFGLEPGSQGASQLSQYESSVQIYEAALVSAQAALNSKKAPPRQVDLVSYRAAVQSASANLDSARANLSKAFIYATVDGVITQKNNEVGESNSSAQPVLVMLTNSNYEIEVNVSEADIAKVILGQISDITLDAFGDEHIFKGIVTMIDPAETLISDVVYYKVKVSIDHDESLKTGSNILEDDLKNIKAGMTASLNIYTNRKDDVLMAPERAIIAKNGKKIIRILVDQKKQTIIEREVVTGLRGNDGLVELIEGGVEGEEVITFIK